MTCITARLRAGRRPSTQTRAAQPLLAERRVNIPGGWSATPGDVLQAVAATFKVTAGVNADYSLAASSPFVVAR